MSDDEKATIPDTKAVSGLPLRRIRVRVVEGPDEGKTVSGDDVVSLGSADGNDLVLTDRTVSRYHVELRRIGNRVSVADLGSTNATTVSGETQLEDSRVTVSPGTTIGLGSSRVKIEDDDVVVADLHASRSLGGIRGASPAMRRVMATVERLSQQEVTLMLLGESGTGKEVVARTLHDLGPRAEQPFVTVDCGAISPHLFASELFGHEKGAFTGAERRNPGAFERANGGTLFLDEVGELPPEIQSGLLGTLERRKVRRVGGSEEIAVDVRVVSATARDLRAEVNASTFRLDLFYRLAVVVLNIPPLRDRPDDIPLLVEHFLTEEGYGGDSRDALFSPDEMRALSRHRWPGNVRELRNVVLATLAMGQSPDLGSSPGTGGSTSGDPIEAVLELEYRDARGRLTKAFEERYLRRLLERSGGNIRQAAREAKMDRSYLMELLRRHGLR